MRHVRAHIGPFRDRPFFTKAEIERICADELQASGCYPKEPGPVRIDRFIEKRFRVVPRSEDLPPGILGYTLFGSTGVSEIAIARSLEEDDSSVARRRSRTTFAHEAGHCLLHAHLFAGDDTQETFSGIDDLQDRRILCRDEPLRTSAVGPGYSGRWWEFQANQAMASLLLPRDHVERLLEPFLRQEGSLGLRTVAPERREAAVEQLAETFDVNPVVARFFIQALFQLDGNGQLKL